MSPWLFNLYMDGVMKELEMGVAGNDVRMMENGDEWEVPYLLYADDLVLWGESEESLRGLVKRFGRVCKRRGLKVNVDKSKVMVVSEDSPQCEVTLDGEQLEQVSEFKYLGYMLDEKGTDDAECSSCLLYTSDAADERSSVDLGGRRIIKKKKKRWYV